MHTSTVDMFEKFFGVIRIRRHNGICVSRSVEVDMIYGIVQIIDDFDGHLRARILMTERRSWIHTEGRQSWVVSFV